MKQPFFIYKQTVLKKICWSLDQAMAFVEQNSIFPLSIALKKDWMILKEPIGVLELFLEDLKKLKYEKDPQKFEFLKKYLVAYLKEMNRVEKEYLRNCPEKEFLNQIFEVKGDR